MKVSQLKEAGTMHQGADCEQYGAALSMKVCCAGVFKKTAQTMQIWHMLLFSAAGRSIDYQIDCSTRSSSSLYWFASLGLDVLLAIEGEEYKANCAGFLTRPQ